MATSKFIKKNVRHFYGRYSAEEFEDIIETEHAGAEHNRVNKEHVEVYDEDSPTEERDIGVNKISHKVNDEYGLATSEDFKVNKGGTKDEDNWRNMFPDLLRGFGDDCDETEEDCDE